MSEPPCKTPGPKPPEPARHASREDRLKAALKANMARRKAQMRARAEAGGDGTGDMADKDED